MISIAQAGFIALGIMTITACNVLDNNALIYHYNPCAPCLQKQHTELANSMSTSAHTAQCHAIKAAITMPDNACYAHCKDWGSYYNDYCKHTKDYQGL